FVIGGTGLIGRAGACRLLAHGWGVGVGGREAGNMPADLGEAGGRFIGADYRDADQLAAPLCSGAAPPLHRLCFTPPDARRPPPCSPLDLFPPPRTPAGSCRSRAMPRRP